MREILFRAKRADNGEWVESDCVMQFKPHPFYQRDMIQLWQPGDGWVECDRATVGQFTGLTDKNGKRIFEGDIVKGSWNTVFAVYYDDCYLQFRAKKAGGYERAIDYYGESKDCEVIGNIHDNPDLV